MNDVLNNRNVIDINYNQHSIDNYMGKH